ncbi:hypothetical protein FRB94_013257 [Tulasnella sp. JGI-2019a]|nr:hypothetical protein FRB93_001963 [Tulasnella sp. JGI-2019a]KAG9008433.1 hypothetical protein FRB94_013257 [Tulasnella sp. JGI-2019a]KAG9031438.1 hypothetical protein FRB95_002738 [Tulasnella sp. JGI-2019a]
MATENGFSPAPYWSGAAIMREEESYTETVICGNKSSERFMSISCMEPYARLSHEELRLAHMFYVTNASTRAGTNPPPRTWETAVPVPLPETTSPSVPPVPIFTNEEVPKMFKPALGSSYSTPTPSATTPTRNATTPKPNHPTFGLTSSLTPPLPRGVKPAAPGLGFGKYAAPSNSGPARFGAPAELIAPHPSWMGSPRATAQSPSTSSFVSDISKRSATSTPVARSGETSQNDIPGPAAVSERPPTTSEPAGFGLFAARPRHSVSFDRPPPEALAERTPPQSAGDALQLSSGADAVSITTPGRTPGSSRSSGNQLLSEDDDLNPGLQAAERTWEESRRQLGLRKDALRRAKEDYDAAVLEEKASFKAYSDARLTSQ